MPTNGSFALLLPELIGSRLRDESLYAARVNQVLLHGAPYDAYSTEGRQGLQWLHGDSLSTYILAGIAWLCGGNLNLGWAVAVALLGALWFALFYGIFKWWSRREEVAIPLALFSVFFPDFYFWLLDVNLNWAVVVHRYAAVFFQEHGAILPYSHRLPSPFLSLFLLGLVLTQTWALVCQSQPRLAASALLGIAYSLMIFVHAYEYVFGMAVLVVLLACVWMIDRRGHRLWNLVTSLFCSLAIPAIYAWAVLSKVDSQAQKDSLEIMGLAHSHKFYLITLIHLLFAGFGFYQYRRENDPRRRAAWLLLAATQVAIFSCRNSQVITGLIIQPFHYIPLGSFLGCLMLFLWLAQSLARKSWWNSGASATASVLLLMWALANEKSAAESTFMLFGLPRDAEAGLHWLRKSAPVDALVLSLSMETNELVPLYTRAKVQVPPLGDVVVAPMTRERYLYKTAQLLKTCRADVDLFLAERWVVPRDQSKIQAQLHWEQFYFQYADLVALEPAAWWASLYGNVSDTPTLAWRQRLKELYKIAEDIKGPFYVWINRKDVHLLHDPAEHFGGKLAYSNKTVDIYEVP